MRVIVAAHRQMKDAHRQMKDAVLTILMWFRRHQLHLLIDRLTALHQTVLKEIGDLKMATP